MSAKNNILLRACEPTDLDLLLDWENNAEVWKVTGTVIPFSKNTLSKYLDSVHDIFADRQFRYIFCEEVSKNPIGIIDLFDFDPHHLRAGVGILVGNNSERNKGYGKAALDALINHSRNHIGIRILYCYILSDNEPSIKVFESAGFKKETTLKNWHRRHDSFVDEHMYILYL